MNHIGKLGRGVGSQGRAFRLALHTCHCPSAGATRLRPVQHLRQKDKRPASNIIILHEVGYNFKGDRALARHAKDGSTSYCYTSTPLQRQRPYSNLLCPAPGFVRPQTTLPSCIIFGSRHFASATSRHNPSPTVNEAQSQAQTQAPPMSLRPYQEECITTCIDQWINYARRRQLVSLPVGSGKTVIFAHLLARLPIPRKRPQATKVMILTHRKELVDQAYNAVTRASPNLKVEIEQAERAADPTADVVIASVPTLGTRLSERLAKFDPQLFKCIIIDEAHHAPTESFGRVLNHFGVLSDDSHIFLWGCSATPARADGVGLDAIFPPPITYYKPIEELIDEGFLVGIRSQQVRTAERLDDVSISTAGESSTRDFVSEQLAEAVNNPSRNRAVVDSWMQLAKDRKSTLVFAVNRQHIVDIAETFKAAGIDARSVDGTTAPKERATILEEFKAQAFPVLVNCEVLTEGVDIPPIDCILMARPTLSHVLYQQMLGRGLRLFGSKRDCLVLDVVDNTQRTNLVTSPSIFGLLPTFNAESRDILETKRQLESLAKHNFAVPHAQSLSEARQQAYEEYELFMEADPGFKKSKMLEDELLNKHATLNWRKFGDGHYALLIGWTRRKVGISVYGVGEPPVTLPPFMMAKMLAAKERFSQRYLTFLPYMASMTYLYSKRETAAPSGTIDIAEGTNLKTIFKHVDDYIMRCIDSPTLLERDAAWKQHPATEAQLQFLQGEMGLTTRPKEWAKFTQGKINFLLSKARLELANFKKREHNQIEVEQEDDLVKSLSKFAWTKVRPRVMSPTGSSLEHLTAQYVLPLDIKEKREIIEVRRGSDGLFRTKYLVLNRLTESSSKSVRAPDHVKEKFAKGSLEWALATAEHFVKTTVPPERIAAATLEAEFGEEGGSVDEEEGEGESGRGSGQGALPSSSDGMPVQRQQEVPATEKQLQLLEKLGFLPGRRMTKREASDRIEQLLVKRKKDKEQQS